MTYLFPALQAAPAAAPSWAPMVFMYGSIILIFYFLVIRPQGKQRRDHESALKGLKRGDKVVTAGGIIAEVIHIKEAQVEGKPKPSMDDEITVKSGDTRLIVERGKIARLTTAASTTNAPAPTK